MAPLARAPCPAHLCDTVFADSYITVLDTMEVYVVDGSGDVLVTNVALLNINDGSGDVDVARAV